MGGVAAVWLVNRVVIFKGRVQSIRPHMQMHSKLNRAEGAVLSPPQK